MAVETNLTISLDRPAYPEAGHYNKPGQCTRDIFAGLHPAVYSFLEAYLT
jgi:hypothetical protein